MKDTPPAGSGPRTPAIPSPVVVPQYSEKDKQPRTTSRDSKESSTYSRRATDTNIPQRSSAIHVGADEISALFAQEAQELISQMERLYATRLEQEKKKMAEILEAERTKVKTMEAKIAALEEELAKRG